MADAEKNHNSNTNKNLSSTYCGPPPSQAVTQWPHRPVYLCKTPHLKTKDYKEGESLPLGKAVDFESDLFVGKVFVRLKDIPNKTDKYHEPYFDEKKRFYQFALQGKFKEELLMSDILVGGVYDKPFKGTHNSIFIRLYEKFMETLSPGIKLELTSDKPKILVSFGSCQIMRIDEPGNEPDISNGLPPDTIQEDMSLLLSSSSSASASERKKKKKQPSYLISKEKRKTYLSKPKNSSKYKVNPNYVYTIEFYDHSMCFGSYYQHVLGGKMDMAPTMNGQPLSFGMFTRNDERVIYKFPLWHERLVCEMETPTQA